MQSYRPAFLFLFFSFFFFFYWQALIPLCRMHICTKRLEGYAVCVLVHKNKSLFLAFRHVNCSLQMVMACHYILQPKTMCSLTSSIGGYLRDTGSYEWHVIRNRFWTQIFLILNTAIHFQVSYKKGKQLFQTLSVSQVKPLGSRSRWSPLLLPLWCILLFAWSSAPPPALLPALPQPNLQSHSCTLRPLFLLSTARSNLSSLCWRML